MGTELFAVIVTIALTVVTSIPLGRYMARVFQGERTLLDPLFVPIERLVIRLSGVDPAVGQDWKQYSGSLLLSNVVMWLATFAIVTAQSWLPLNPDGIGNMEATLAFNTISSFTTNTNLQHYSGETGLSYFSQMFVITFPAVRHGGDRRRRVHRDDSRPGGKPADVARQLLRGHDARDLPRLPAAGARWSRSS